MTPLGDGVQKGKPAKATDRDGFIRHVSVVTSYATETIECVCGAVVTAPPDHLNRDAHGPLIAAWNAHREAERLSRGPGSRSDAWSL